ncbi:MAG TPA: threonylcarbamoyl-AMP synthase [Porphyromonadaceae bacterium]|nr:threonylcarbamoyl-AMP synthase [Porphyromonadaceae bacterium]
MDAITEEVEKVVKVLRGGGIILYPTDTIWGIGCDATSPEAIKKVYEIKKRPDEKSMLILVDSISRLSFYVEEIPEIAYDLIECAEKPLTIIYDKAKNLPKELLPPDGSIGVRITKERFSNLLCARFGRALISTSANISGGKSPQCFNEIPKEIKDSVDYIVKYRQEDMTSSAPSSIMKVSSGGVFKVIRE